MFTIENMIALACLAGVVFFLLGWGARALAMKRYEAHFANNWQAIGQMVW